jgi:hypothetical protein
MDNKKNMFNNKKVERNEDSVTIRPYQPLSRVDEEKMSETYVEQRRVRKLSSSISDDFHKGFYYFIYSPFSLIYIKK